MVVKSFDVIECDIKRLPFILLSNMLALAFALAFVFGAIPISSASHMSFPLLEIFLPTDNCPPVDIDPIDLINEQDRFVNLACPLSSKELLFVLSSSVNTRK